MGSAIIYDRRPVDEQRESCRNFLNVLALHRELLPPCKVEADQLIAAYLDPNAPQAERERDLGKLTDLFYPPQTVSDERAKGARSRTCA